MDELFYDDNGELVPTELPAVAREQSTFEQIVETLDDTEGLPIESRASEIEFLFQEMLAEQTQTAIRDGVTDCLRQLFSRLEGTAAAVALRRVVMGDNGVSLRDEAAQLGCSHVAIYKLESKIRQRILRG